MSASHTNHCFEDRNAHHRVGCESQIKSGRGFASIVVPKCDAPCSQGFVCLLFQCILDGFHQAHLGGVFLNVTLLIGQELP